MKNKLNLNKLVISAIFILAGALASGCSVAGPMADEINPFGDGANPAQLGVRDSSAVTGAGGGGGKEAATARHQLEVLGAYRKAQAPQPVYPVVQPAEVRLMWVPDHLNKHGDLVPAHYYYLRVLNDRWAVQDAFEYDSQLKLGAGQINYGATGATGSGENLGSGSNGSSTPWVYKEAK